MPDDLEISVVIESDRARIVLTRPSGSLTAADVYRAQLLKAWIDRGRKETTGG